ncbi:hypothetical protein [Nesterenkonia suensis]
MTRALIIWWPLAIAGGLFVALNHHDPHLFLIGWTVLTIGALGIIAEHTEKERT